MQRSTGAGGESDLSPTKSRCGGRRRIVLCDRPYGARGRQINTVHTFSAFIKPYQWSHA